LKNAGNQTVDGIELVINEYLFFLRWRSMATINCLFTKILENNFFCVKPKRETLEQFEGE